MKLHVSQGTNPRIVELFLAGKGIELEKNWIDIGNGDNRQPEFLAKNYLGQLPVLELDSGQCISQTTAICEYLEELHPQPPLIGATPEQRAETRMWLRRLDLLIVEPLAQAFKFSTGLFYYQHVGHVMPAAVADFRQLARQNLAQLDEQMAGKKWLCGDRFTLADIQLYCSLNLARSTGQDVVGEGGNLPDWFDRVAQRLG